MLLLLLECGRRRSGRVVGAACPRATSPRCADKGWRGEHQHSPAPVASVAVHHPAIQADAVQQVVLDAAWTRNWANYFLYFLLDFSFSDFFLW